MSAYGEFPTLFWVGVVLLGVLVVEAFKRWREPWAKPAVLIYGTIGAWYFGDIAYETPAGFRINFPDGLINMSLLEVIVFLVIYRLIVIDITKWFIKDLKKWIVFPVVSQNEIDRLFFAVFGIWLVTFTFGLATADWDVIGVIWPPSREHKVGMFGREGIGHGADFLFSAGAYVYLLTCAAFAVFFVIGRGILKFANLFLVILTWPYVWFDRARSGMLVLLLPAVFCFWIIDKSPRLVKIPVTLLLFLCVHFWFLGVAHYREDYGSVSEILDVENNLEAKHEGLDMLKELCWINYFIETGDYKMNYGEEYFSEAVNFVPRSIWPGKPTIGLDYAVVRGFGGNDDSESGVFATIATGLIGQGVCNFGQTMGLASAAFLCAVWTGILSRLWIQSNSLPRLVLFMMGCGLTFNLGRDITLLVLWPFLFGYILIRILEEFGISKKRVAAPAVRGDDVYAARPLLR